MARDNDEDASASTTRKVWYTKTMRLVLIGVAVLVLLLVLAAVLFHMFGPGAKKTLTTSTAPTTSTKVGSIFQDDPTLALPSYVYTSR